MNVTQASSKPFQQIDFLDLLGHDLREPARLVAQFLTLVKDRNDDTMDEKSHEFLEYAISASQKMDKMIQAISRMSRLQSSYEDKEVVDMLSLTEHIHSDLMSFIEKRKARVIYKGAKLISSRKEAIHSILKELVLNSLIHAQTDDELRIEISAKQVDRSVRVQVKDNGNPLPEKWREKVFEPFQKYAQNSPNLGAGLAKSRILVEKYDGNISMEVSELEETVVICTLN